MSLRKRISHSRHVLGLFHAILNLILANIFVNQSLFVSLTLESDILCKKLKFDVNGKRGVWERSANAQRTMMIGIMFFEQKLQFTEIKNYISRMPEAVPK